jgi:serine/threonine protein kinase
LIEERAGPIFSQVLSAISYCHRHDFYHGNINPEAIRFISHGEDLEIKLTDFGQETEFESVRE